ncbi:MAG: helix-turn-helix domain-containing protein [Clostridia bacterium]|nr:helix-turn-helix domain-containing protein [Clostridia bacterium]
MSIMLDENIKRFRKERGLTQEQLAEALGVTVGAVYKWENGRSTPEIEMLLQLADLFEVSLDALIGFEAQNGSATALDERIFELQRQKKYADAITEAEKALLRYPNNFYIVYRAGSLYGVAGGEQNNHKYLRRAIELLERTITLLEQNTSPEINEAVIRGDIAQHYIALGNVEKGVEILKSTTSRVFTIPFSPWHTPEATIFESIQAVISKKRSHICQAHFST